MGPGQLRLHDIEIGIEHIVRMLHFRIEGALVERLNQLNRYQNLKGGDQGKRSEQGK